MRRAEAPFKRLDHTAVMFQPRDVCADLPGATDGHPSRTNALPPGMVVSPSGTAYFKRPNLGRVRCRLTSLGDMLVHVLDGPPALVATPRLKRVGKLLDEYACGLLVAGSHVLPSEHMTAWVYQDRCHTLFLSVLDGNTGGGIARSPRGRTRTTLSGIVRQVRFVVGHRARPRPITTTLYLRARMEVNAPHVREWRIYGDTCRHQRWLTHGPIRSSSASMFVVTLVPPSGMVVFQAVLAHT
jgi:hypothetical protein